MFDSKFKTIFILLAQCALLNACAPSAKSAKADPKSVKVSTDLLCQDQNYDVISKSTNREQMLSEFDYHVNTLSGAAVELKELLESPKLIEKSKGLSQVCEQDYQTLEVGCNGDIKVTGANKSETLTPDQLFEKSPLYVKSATFCGGLLLKESDALYVVADQIKFQKFSARLEKSAVLSLSARELTNATSGTVQFNQAPGSAVMLHAYSLK